MYPALNATPTQQSTAATANSDHTYLNKANTKIKEAAKTASVQVKAQAEQIYQAYSVKNWERTPKQRTSTKDGATEDGNHPRTTDRNDDDEVTE